MIWNFKKLKIIHPFWIPFSENVISEKNSHWANDFSFTLTKPDFKNRTASCTEAGKSKHLYSTFHIAKMEFLGVNCSWGDKFKHGVCIENFEDFSWGSKSNLSEMNQMSFLIVWNIKPATSSFPWIKIEYKAIPLNFGLLLHKTTVKYKIWCNTSRLLNDIKKFGYFFMICYGLS